MERYEKYKDSGIECIGEIPEHWNINKVKHNFSFKTGFTPPSGKTEYYEDGKHIWINISDLQEKEIYDSANKITDKAIEDYKPNIVPKGSLLYSFKLSVGRVGFNMVDCYTNEAIFSIDPNGSANLNFFYYSLPEQIIKNANENIYGAKILNQELIKNAVLVVPTPEEQTAIANYLDRKTAEIDELIADKKRLLELYEEEKTAIINQAVTKGINPEVPMKDSGIEWLGEIPEHWEVLPIKYTANVQTGRTPKIANSDIDFFENGDTNWYTPGDFNGNEILKESKRKIISEAFEKNQVELFPKQSIYLVSIGATIGKVSLSESEASANQQINIISFNKEKVIPHWGYYFIVGNKEMVLNEADYTTLPILNQTKLKNVLIAFPNIEEQKNIIAHVNDELDRLRLIVGNTKKLIDLLTEYRTALISEVVTGKIKVTE
jgi:type I restriction enzyme S subunit